MNIYESVKKQDAISPGHRACAGCAMPIIAKTILSVVDGPVVVSNATGCMEVTTTIYPHSAWNVPWIHNTFENAAATLSGVETAYRALKKRGKITQDFKFIAFGGDGGTYDIGLQSLSGALERGHDFTYVVYDNEGYMNTGGQRSSATPFAANTTTDPVGKVRKGKQEWRKDLLKIAAAHGIKYAAQASISNIPDLLMKAKKAIETKGPTILLILSPCVALWKYPTDKTVEIAKKAVDSNFWPLYEIENGYIKLNYDPKDRKIPVEEFVKLQGRYSHLLKEENKPLLEKLQKQIDEEFEKIKKLSESGLQVF
ncbi:MAG: pyruvate ferredoxin oxidoreductase beta subunit [Candidatus Woesearchaeota archaeon]|nr:pyruvate ferredoxin oxidoreductase beta subunit [Candidatus Woesearchaeota archaeon]MDN5328102.1 pyruvate ferredoxin oxidoreductase beta subunit [Candidatus Woesearchaeota archaeon]